MTYGVTPTGFTKKLLAEILAEIEQENRDRFGAGIRQDAQSPLGQINGLFSDYTGDLWDLGEALFSSLDPDQAIGPRLDQLGRIRRIDRAEGESDASYRQRMTQQGQANIRPLRAINAVRAVDGVSWAALRVNATAETDALGLPAHSLAFAALGGDDMEIAETIVEYTTAGIGLYGNVTVPVEIDEYTCQVQIVRPAMVPVTVEIDVVRIDDGAAACSAPTAGQIAEAVYLEMLALNNGILLTTERVGKPADKIESISVVEVRIVKTGEGSPGTSAIPFTLFERPSIPLANITVTFVDDGETA